ncbi:MAG: nucleoside deaminase [Nanoarchaeota archaeon]
MTAEEKFMLKAIEAARESGRKGDYAIGSVVVKDGKIISVGEETLKSANDPVNGHAEIDAIRKACKKLNQPYLEGGILYSTHEPCPMCASAAIWAKMEGIVFSVSRDDMINEMKKKMGEKFSWRQIEIPCKDILKKGNPQLKLISGFMRDEGLKLFNLTK